MKLSRILPRLTALLLVLCCLTSCTQLSSLFQSESERFDSYTNELFLGQLRANSINLNYTLADPQAYGLEEYEVVLYDTQVEDYPLYYEEQQRQLDYLRGFDYDAFTSSQQVTYDILEYNYETELLAKDLYLYTEPLSPTTGFQAELPILLAEFSFRRQQDVEDYLTLLGQVGTAFENILELERARSEAGLFPPDFVVDGIIDQCSQFIEDPENNYLIPVFEDRLEGLSELSEEQRNTYIQRNREAVLESVIPAYQTLIDGLEELKGTGVNDKGLYYFEDGREYYEYLVRSSVGTTRPIPELQQMTDKFLQQSLMSILELAQEEGIWERYNSCSLPFDSPEAMLEDLRQKIAADFPQLDQVSYSVKTVHESLAEHLSPAFYLTPPIDDTQNQAIYLNPLNTQDDDLYLYTTLAHEGFPGHLYQNSYSRQCGLDPIRSLLTSTGYSEGWAVYAEVYSYSLLENDPEVCQLAAADMLCSLSVSAMVDMGVHYDGWDLIDVTDYLRAYGLNIDAAQAIYEAVIKDPANYLNYFIGYLEMMELRNTAEEALGSEFSALEYHEFLLSLGSAPYEVLEKYLDRWLDSRSSGAGQSEPSPSEPSQAEVAAGQPAAA